MAPYVFFGRLSHAAADGSPVLVWRAGQADYSGFVREELVTGKHLASEFFFGIVGSGNNFRKVVKL